MANSNTTNSYLTPPQLHGVRNSDGTYTLSELEMKAQSDFNYRVAKMLQGELNLKNLNADTNQVFTDLEGNVTTVTETAAGLSVSVSNLSGEVSTVSATINGLDVTTSGETTYITGDHVKTGTLEGVIIVSTGGSSGQRIAIQDGEIVIGDSAYGAVLKFDGSKVVLDSVTAPLKINSLVNMSIDAGGTIYIGTSNVGQTIEIGSATARIDLNGAVYKNGVPL